MKARRTKGSFNRTRKSGRRTHACAASVVVATRNRAHLLARCVRALQKQAGPSVQEIVVVDDASTDRTSVVLRELAGAAAVPLRTITCVTQSGPAAARNLGWHAAVGRIVAFTDDDCVPSPDWIENLVHRLVGSPRNVVGVGGRVLPEGNGLVSRYMGYHRILEPPPSLSYLVTANCAYRRNALEEVGGFDESIKTPGGEDPGLAFSLARRGFTFAFEPKAVVTHTFRESIPDFVKTFFRYGRGCRLVMG